MFEELLLIKDQYDVESLKFASRFGTYVMKQLIHDIEEDIENNKGEKHDSISSRFDKIFDSRKKMDAFLEQLPPALKPKLDEACLEFAFPVNI